MAQTRAEITPREQPFEIVSQMKPTGDQPSAIADIVARKQAGERKTTLLGATGTGKTFTMANVIEQVGKPTLILSHNKTLAAQLYEEMRELFPNNAVSYFVSYYDYYQPEAYIPARDIYIEKDASRNDDLDRLRLAATSNLLSRSDTIVVASVSCIFGLGSPGAYEDKVFTVAQGLSLDRREFLHALTDMQYQRAPIDFKRGTFRVQGDVIDIYPAYEKFAIRVDLWGDEVESIALIDPLTGEELAQETMVHIFPAVHYVMPEERMKSALDGIREELDARVIELRSEGKLLEAQRLLARTKHDLEMLEEVGVCPGIENYSRYLDGRKQGERPYTLMDYFRVGAARLFNDNANDWLMMIDESHVTLPQVRAMFNGDKARKQMLVDHGFRLPSALDNRPLTFEEFETVVPQVLFVSATPGPYELEKTEGEIVEQVIRPTGLLDPQVQVRPAGDQVQDVLDEAKVRIEKGERVLVTALTKRLCEDLTSYLDKQGVRVRYLHSDVETLDRLEILRDLREGAFDVLVGVNLLREGLDLPEVSLVCILDADKAGFLRGETALVQTIGRAARNVNGTVIMYADEMTPAMQAAIEETERRRAKQQKYNEANGITPETIIKSVRRGIETELAARKKARAAVGESEPEVAVSDLVAQLEEEMLEAAQSLEFEKAAALRDQLNQVKNGKFANKEAVKRSDVEEAADEGMGKRGRLRGRSSTSPNRPGRPGYKKRK